MSYSLEGVRWSQPQITWSFEDSGVSTNGGFAYSDPIADPVQQALVEQALSDWQAHSGVTFYQVADSQPQATAPDIRIGLGDLLGQPGQTDTIGLTDYYYYQSTDTFASGVYVALQDPAVTPLQADGSGTLLYAGTDSSFYQVILHEIGHALGLDHDTTDTSAVMYPVAMSTNRELGASDIAGIDSLYGANTGNDQDQTEIFMSGTIGEYTLAQNGSGTLVVTDHVGGRDGVTAIATDRFYSFGDGTAFADPNGNGADVARLYLAAFDRAPDLGGLENYVGAANAGLGLVQIANDLVSSTEFSSRFGGLDTMSFISAAYENVLHRAPDAGGLQTYENAVNSGVSRGQVLVDLSQSQESRAVNIDLAGDHDDAEIDRLYGAALDRAPDAGGLQAYAAALENGTSIAALAQGLTSSVEFQSLYGGLSNTSFVQSLYQNTLHRAADPGGLASYTNALNSGVSRAAVVVSIADSLENRNDTASATHDGYVFLAGT